MSGSDARDAYEYGVGFIWGEVGRGKAKQAWHAIHAV